MTIRQIAERTPDDRNRVVDLLRVAALAAVVLGHWLKQGWYVEPSGELHRAGLLGIAPWSHPITWAFQVIPVFFVVGGYANARSYRSARSRDAHYGGWLASRVERLTRPVLPLLAFWVLVTPVAWAWGEDNRWLTVASVTSLVPTWFLATYVVVTALTPVCVTLWERWGILAAAVTSLLALVVDAVSIALDEALVGVLNLLLVWGTLHVVGVAWADGWFRTRSRAWALATVGGSVAVLLVVLGPYGVSMVGVSGYGVNNTNPPRATVLFLGFLLVGVAIGLEDWLRRVAARPRVWICVVAVEARLMTVYLWHLTALGVLGAASLAFDGWGLRARPDTSEWWLLRPAWLLALGLTTAVLVLAVGRWEDPVWRRVSPGLSAWLPCVEVAVTCVGLAVLASEGMTRGVVTWAVAVGSLVTLSWLDRAMVRAPDTAGTRFSRAPTDPRR